MKVDFGLQFRRCQSVMSGAVWWNRVVDDEPESRGGGIERGQAKHSPGTAP